MSQQRSGGVWRRNNLLLVLPFSHRREIPQTDPAEWEQDWVLSQAPDRQSYAETRPSLCCPSVTAYCGISSSFFFFSFSDTEFLCSFGAWSRTSPCRPGWPWTHRALTQPPCHPPWVMGLKAQATTPSSVLTSWGATSPFPSVYTSSHFISNTQGLHWEIGLLSARGPVL